MSKMDNLRAMREARYAEAQARAAKPAAGATGPKGATAAKSAVAKSGAAKSGAAKSRPARALRAVPPVDPSAPGAVEEPAVAEEELCGHRNMGGRTCTREKGHTAKSHRYS